MLARAVFAAILGQRRSFLVDAKHIMAGAGPPDVRGREHLPATGPFLLVANHYTRPGMHVWWPVLALSSQLPVETRWLVAGGWTYPAGLQRLLLEPLTALAFQRLARVYAFTPMPPMPPRPGDAAARAAAVRSVFHDIRSLRLPQSAGGQDRLSLTSFGLMPEGRDIPGGALGWPPAGAGRLMLRLSAELGQILPAGVFEAHGSLCLRFGPAFCLEAGAHPSAAQQDQAATRAVMEHIAALLPQTQRGPFN